MGEMADWEYDQGLSQMAEAEEPAATVYFDEVMLDRNDLGAILFRIDKREIWIPRSLIDQLDEGSNEMEIPEWFAIQEELI